MADNLSSFLPQPLLSSPNALLSLERPAKPPMTTQKANVQIGDTVFGRLSKYFQIQGVIVEQIDEGKSSAYMVRWEGGEITTCRRRGFWNECEYREFKQDGQDRKPYEVPTLKSAGQPNQSFPSAQQQLHQPVASVSVAQRISPGMPYSNGNSMSAAQSTFGRQQNLAVYDTIIMDSMNTLSQQDMTFDEHNQKRRRSDDNTISSQYGPPSNHAASYYAENTTVFGAGSSHFGSDSVPGLLTTRHLTHTTFSSSQLQQPSGPRLPPPPRTLSIPSQPEFFSSQNGSQVLLSQQHPYSQLSSHSQDMSPPSAGGTHLHVRTSMPASLHQQQHLDTPRDAMPPSSASSLPTQSISTSTMPPVGDGTDPNQRGRSFSNEQQFPTSSDASPTESAIQTHHRNSNTSSHPWNSSAASLSYYPSSQQPQQQQQQVDQTLASSHSLPQYHQLQSYPMHPSLHPNLHSSMTDGSSHKAGMGNTNLETVSAATAAVALLSNLGNTTNYVGGNPPFAAGAPGGNPTNAEAVLAEVAKASQQRQRLHRHSSTASETAQLPSNENRIVTSSDAQPLQQQPQPQPPPPQHFMRNSLANSKSVTSTDSREEIAPYHILLPINKIPADSRTKRAAKRFRSDDENGHDQEGSKSSSTNPCRYVCKICKSFKASHYCARCSRLHGEEKFILAICEPATGRDCLIQHLRKLGVAEGCN
jgi:hypothetical protein